MWCAICRRTGTGTRLPTTCTIRTASSVHVWRASLHLIRWPLSATNASAAPLLCHRTAINFIFLRYTMRSNTFVLDRILSQSGTYKRSLLKTTFLHLSVTVSQAAASWGQVKCLLARHSKGSLLSRDTGTSAGVGTVAAAFARQLQCRTPSPLTWRCMVNGMVNRPKSLGICLRRSKTTARRQDLSQQRLSADGVLSLSGRYI